MSKPLKAETLAGGALLEAIDYGLDELMQNIKDVNTDAKKARTLSVKITVKADANRNLAALSFETKTGLVMPVPVETSIMIDKDAAGKAVAAEMYPGENPEQHSLLPDDDLTGGKAIPFAKQA